MSGADTVCVQERLHIFHLEVQRRQLRHSYPSSAYVLHSSHALARGCLVQEFPSPLRVILPPLFGSKIHLENRLHVNHGFGASNPESICHRGRYVL